VKSELQLVDEEDDTAEWSRVKNDAFSSILGEGFLYLSMVV
jgi:hypothetical protein